MIGHRIIRHAVVASTMDEILRLAAKGEPEGLVVVADEQTSGRGRSGRVWTAKPGTSVLLSVLLRPAVTPDRLAPLSLVVGLAVAQALEAFGMTPALKWPNDVWLNERKVAGVLVQSTIGVDGIVAVLGIGINVLTAAADLPPGATSIHATTGFAQERDDLLATVLARLDAGYSDYVVSEGHPNLAGWSSRAALVGEDVQIRDGDSEHRGTFRGIDADGVLLLDTGSGSTLRIVAGVVTRGPRRVPQNG